MTENNQSNDIHFKKLMDVIFVRLGLNCRNYNEPYMKRRLNARILANDLKMDDYNGYINVLTKSEEEIRKLFDTLTVNVTEFFRDVELWASLEKDVFPKMIKDRLENKGKALYVWSSGCSSGEEAYSIAIMLKELTANNNITPNILASDIDDLSLEKAKAGIYTGKALTNVPSYYLSKYFHHTAIDGKDAFEVDSAVKSLVKFQKNDFFKDNPPGDNFDMIFCRNVVIYFTAEAKDKLMGIFHKALVQHGWLVTGKSEVLFTKHLIYKFYLYNELERIYRKERRQEVKPIESDHRKNWWPGYKGQPNTEKTL